MGFGSRQLDVHAVIDKYVIERILVEGLLQSTRQSTPSFWSGQKTGFVAKGGVSHQIVDIHSSSSTPGEQCQTEVKNLAQVE